MKGFIVKSSVKLLNTIAEKSSVSACIWLAHQPKEPKSLQNKK